MDLPVMPPVAPMLAKLKEAMPVGEGWLYEPKWDGFRAIVFRDGDELLIASRDKKPLDRYFPELAGPLKAALPVRCVVDGEIVVAAEGGLDFDALLLRIHPAASRVKMLAAEHPTSFVAFDLLAEGDTSHMETAFGDRRAALEAFLPQGSPDEVPGTLEVLLTLQTEDPDQGQQWFEGLEVLGLDGIIAKRTEGTYKPNERSLVKVKHKHTVDCVVAGYRPNKTKDGIGSLLLGLYSDGVLHYVGHTSSFKAAERREMLKELKEIEGDGGFGAGRTPGGPSRWKGGQEDTWVALQPILTCEVSYDYLQGDRFRHASTFQRWRPDKPPEECVWDQLHDPRRS
jgi:ATP-dependent DNA ligase